MRNVTHRSMRLLACAALLLTGTIAVGQPEAVKKGKALIEANAKKICEYAHAPSTYTYNGVDYLGEKTTKDGLHELTFQFTVKGTIKTQTMMMSFFFKDNGNFEFLRPGKVTTIYEPFTKLSAGYLKQLRTDMTKRPAVAGDAALTRKVESESAQELCERFIRQQQSR